MRYSRLLAPGLAVLAVGAGLAVMLSGLVSSEAVQNPTLSLDMVTTGSTYTPSDDADFDGLPDPGTNVMNVGAIDGCLSTAAPGNNVQHTHAVHIVVRNVEDLIGWQTRLNYDGGKMRPHTVSFTPFTDTFTAQTVSFVNLPFDQTTFVHRDIVTGSDIPPAAPGPQTALIGSVYLGSQNFPISPDTPAKATPDNNTYDAPTGGVVATLNLQVLAGNAGQTLSMDVDDASPNAPGSSVIVFTSSGSQEINLTESALGDGLHDEGSGSCVPGPCPPSTSPTPSTFTTTQTFTNNTGQSASDLHARYNGPVGICVLENAPGCPSASITPNPIPRFGFNMDWGTACVDNGESVTVQVTSEPPATLLCYNWTIFGAAIGNDCDATPTTTPSATPTVTPTPVTGHDARLSRIGGVPHQVRLMPGEVITDSASIVVANDGDHTETIGVYVDVVAPAAGACMPFGRVLETTVSLAARGKITIPVPVDYMCPNPAASDGESYTWIAVADHGADDLSSCDVGALQSLACFNALADDDEDPSDNRKGRVGPKLVAE